MMDKVNFPKTNNNKFFGKSCIFFATCSPRFDYVVWLERMTVYKSSTAWTQMSLVEFRNPNNKTKDG